MSVSNLLLMTYFMIYVFVPLNRRVPSRGWNEVKNVGVTQMNLRKIRKFEPEFTTTDFAWKAQQIYTDAHNALQE